MLTKPQLLQLNQRMLGLGAPVVVDGAGYSKHDFTKFYNFGYKTDISDYEAYTLVNGLKKYSKTQLTDYALEIANTAEHYNKQFKGIQIIDFDAETIKISWEYNKAVSNFIRADFDKSYFKWLKPNGQWVLDVKWVAIDLLITQFKNNGFDTSAIDDARIGLKDLPPVAKKAAEPVVAIVTRPDTTTDTLKINIPYNADVVAAIKTVPYVFFNKSDVTWEFYIEYAAMMYDKLNGLGISNLDLTSLKVWADLVSGWNNSYELIDLENMVLPFVPYDFQIEDAKRLLDLRVGLNANDMGCGKTFEQIIIGESIPMKKLVICPPTLRLNWKREIQMVNKNANINIIYNTDDFKAVDGWNIIGYTSLEKFSKELESANFQVLMIDEAHYIQAINNSGKADSKRAFNVLRLAATAAYVYPITGTPKTNRNKNLYNILKVIRHPLTRGKWAFGNYGRIYCDGKSNRWGWDFDGNSNDEDLNTQLVPYMVRHLKKDVLPHLKKQRIVTPVECDLREYHYEIAEYLKNRTNKNAEDLARLMRARKILATQKVGESVDFAKDLIHDGKKVVIVTCFTEVVKAVEKAFDVNVVKLVGGMSDAAKDKAIQDFQTGEPQVMVMNIVAGGVGVTLTSAYNMVINDFDWTPGNLTQAEDRICRSGQVEEFCNIYYLYAAGADMDEVFADTLTYKFDTINNVVDGGAGDSINYLDLINDALEKSTGIKKVRRILKADDIQADTVKSQPKIAANKSVDKKDTQTLKAAKNDKTPDFKGLTIEQLEDWAKSVNADYKHYDEPKIHRMRLIMAIKKAIA